MTTRASLDDVNSLLRRCTVLESKVATLGNTLKSNQRINETGLMKIKKIKMRDS